MMRRFGYILTMAILLLTGCRHEELEMPGQMAPEGERVELSFKVAVPSDGTATKAMGINPTIDTDGFYIAVFGGSGYFNEWVKATVQAATANYDGSNNTVYTITASLTVSDSRLRLHFIANCPPSIRTSPPISGSSDTEEYVMSHIRSQLTDTYNDGYWQKVILPNGVRVTKNEGVYVATTATLKQLPNPIIMVRNFARVYLRNLTPILKNETTGESHQLVTIKKFGLAYAPSEGVIAPILSAPYMSSTTGSPITVAEDDETTPVYYENFLMNYQRYPIISDSPSDTLVTAAPFNYGGFSPSDQAYDYYAAEGHTDRGTPILTDLRDWDDEHPENNVLFVYERTIPSVGKRATRLIIQAERVDQNGVSEGDKFYALDIINTEGVTIPLLRNQTYTVLLRNIESGSGETDISKASQATSATVSGDPDFQNLVNISDGKSSIGTSFTEKFYVQPQEDYVMFRYLPTNIDDETYAANTEGNELVTIKVGSFDSEHGGFTELTPAQASAQGILAFKTNDAGNEYKVWIVKDQNTNKAISYVRSNNEWVEATAAQIADATIEKWGMIKYQLSESYMDSGRFFTAERSQAIHVIGSYDDRVMSRDVIIKTSPRQSMKVRCLQKYVKGAAGEEEVVRIMMPTGLSRSVFPLEFTIEADNYSLTPNGDIMPVTYGTSTIPNVDTPAFYFVKTIPTETEYKALLTIRDENGITWKYIDCPFKTTVAQNASAVYVDSHFFNNEDANDEFFNYEQRLFTNQSGGDLALANTVFKNANTTFSFSLDYANRSKTHVWWDPTNTFQQSANAEEAREKGLSTSYRVLPPIISVTLDGFTPTYEANPKLVHSDGHTYLYYVGTNGAPTSDMANVTLSLTATGNIGTTGTVTLSTANITENPDLYVLASASRQISGATLSGSFSPSTLPLGLYQTTSFSFTYADGLVEPVTIQLSGLKLHGNDARMRANGDGSYTFTPTDANTRTYSISLESTTRYSAGSIVLENEDYEPLTVDIPRAGSIVIPAGTIYARGYEDETHTNVAPTTLGNRTVTISSTKGGSSVGSVTFNTTTFLNTANVTVNTNSFALSDNTPVYFYYTNTNRYDGQCTLDEIMDVIEGTSSQIRLNLYRWATGTYSINFKNSSNENVNSFTDSGASKIAVNLTNCSGTHDTGWQNYRKDIGNSNNAGTISISLTNSSPIWCKITGVGFEYAKKAYGLGSTLNTQAVTVNGTTLSDKTSWTSPNAGSEGGGETTVTVTMAKPGNREDPNSLYTLSVNYGYWDY